MAPQTGFTLLVMPAEDLFEAFRSRIATSEPADLEPGPRAGVLSQLELNRIVEDFLSESKLPLANGDLVRSLVLLWHDHLDAAHVIAQNIENADGSFVHGILHRREPDYGNAKYWFRRVGNHRCFPEIARKVAVLPGLDSDGDLARKLIHDGEWNSVAFIDVCEKAAVRAVPDPQRRLLCEIQRIEFEILLECFCRRA
ncbi:MAG: hypothetical protein HY298_24235 [Verrucomicrobia bacterium]|nr:hypothetical protein [Verrucomicrobiota bacterium]